jgi:cyanophycinase
MVALYGSGNGTSRGALMPIGGAEDKMKARRILSSFLGLAGGAEARIAVIPAASTQAGRVGDLYHALFCDLGAAAVEIIHVDSRQDAHDGGRVAALAQMSAIFLTGGNQLRLSTLLGGTPMGRAIQQHNRAGCVVAGTSAGASILSEHMIAFGRNGESPAQRMVQLAPGLGLTNHVVIDQHFQQRGRIGRLMTAVAYNPSLIGLGIDEDTAAIIDDSYMLQIVGRGSVVVVDGSELSYTNLDQAQRHAPVAITDLRLHILTEGLRYDILNRRPILPNDDGMMG